MFVSNDIGLLLSITVPTWIVCRSYPSFHMLGTGLVKWIFVRHSLLNEVKMGAYYINYYFHNIEYDDGFYGGEFSAPDYRVYCKFLYDRETKEFIDIWDNTQPIDEILPIPIWWLDNKLEKNGKLGKNESKVSI